jgi:CheY-like chemotaxis protein
LSKAGDFDLVITDMQMPEVDGVALAKAIKEKTPDLPIILLSSIGDEHKKQYEHLFRHILTKPVKQKVLSNAITAELRKQDKSVVAMPEAQKKLSARFAESHPLHILIAEDNPVNQTLIVRTLAKLGFEPGMAENGIAALDALQRGYYNLILMDVQMPEMDGLEATRAIRKDQSGEQPVIIAMTANAMTEDKEICLEAGMDDYISKPIKLEKLMEVLEKWSVHIQKNQKKVS